MFSRILFLSLIIVSLRSTAQIIQYRDLVFNNVGFRINTDGNLFENAPDKKAFYRIPAYSTSTTIYAANLWFGATLPNGDTATTIGTYILNGQETMIGPTSNNYDAAFFQRYYRTWPMDVVKIKYHREHFQDQGYVPDSAITDWPANGREGIDIGPFAPYADVNNNNTYDPENGDYPHIPGDMAVFFFKNSANPQAANTTGGKKLQLAISGFLFAFATDYGPLSTTVFIRTTVKNAGTETLNNFYAGIWTDGDIGESTDDFAGSIPSKNAVFTYNADNSDNNFGGNPPAQSFAWLNTPLSSASIYNTTQITEPFDGYSTYYFLLSGKDLQGQEKADGLFDFPDNPSVPAGNSEFAFQNQPSDRRMLAPTLIGTMQPGESTCLDGAWVWSRNEDLLQGTNLKNVTSLDTLITSVSQFYSDFLGNDCMYYTTSVAESAENTVFQLFPNPGSGLLNIQYTGKDANKIVIYDTFGRSILQQDFSTKLQLADLPAGTYFLSIILKNGTHLDGKAFVLE